MTALPTIPDGAQVRVSGSHTFTISKGTSPTRKLSVGKKKLEWRTDARAGWKPGPTIELAPGKTTKIQLTFTGPRVLAN